MVSFPYYSHIFKNSYGSGMEIVWEAYHKGVPCPWGSLESPLTSSHDDPRNFWHWTANAPPAPGGKRSLAKVWYMAWVAQAEHFCHEASLNIISPRKVERKARSRPGNFGPYLGGGWAHLKNICQNGESSPRIGVNINCKYLRLAIFWAV